MAPRFLRAQEAALSADEAAGGRMPALKLSARSLAMLDESPANAAGARADRIATVQGGSIARAELRAELQRGIGRFLGDVRAKPTLVRGRFAGWRLLELFKKRPEVHVHELRVGDTVLKINGRSLERPEQLKLVWDSLAEASELLVEIERDAQRRLVRYAITDLPGAGRADIPVTSPR